MTDLTYSLNNVTLNQSNAFQPQLNVRLEMKYTKLSYQPKQAENIQITGVKGKLNVKGKNSPQFEIGVAEQEQSSNVRLGDMVILYLTLRLTPYLLNRIEEFRSGGDLWFNFEPLPSGLTVAYQDVSNNVDLINFQASGNTMWKYPKSEWIDQLNTTEFNKIELIEIPIIELPEIPLTEEVMKFVSQATKAMNEGRYGDVLFECRKVIDALDKGIEEWGKNTTLNAEEKLKLEDIKSKSNGKRIGKREEELSKLMADVEKGVRLGMVIGNLHYYLSLNPHEAEHKSNFTVDDAKFVIHSITSYARNILKYIENKQA